VSYAEFYCNPSTGAQINAGDNKTVVTSTNGGWSTVTNVFTAAAGTPFSAVTAGDFASVYNDGATVTVYVARVTSVDGGGATLTLSTTSIAGTAPTTSGTGRSCTTGGAWKGPNGTDDFPFDFVAYTLTDASGNQPRVNLKNNATYSITASLGHSLMGVIFQGYTSTVGDGGKFVVDGGTSGSDLLILSGTQNMVIDGIFQNNGGGGSPNGLSLTGYNQAIRCIATGIRGTGFAGSSACNTFIECEAYGCNLANSGSKGGFTSSGNGDSYVRCISHDNTTGNSSGFVCTGTNAGANYHSCISDSNTLYGFHFSGNISTGTMIGCDCYNNGSDGIRLASGFAGNPIYIENCNLIRNGGYGINRFDTNSRNMIWITNCGFGSGTKANTSGTTTGLPIASVNDITYAANVVPWFEPDGGNFSVLLNTAKGTGRGNFTQSGSYTGTVGYPDMGAAQAKHGGSKFVGQGGGLVG
jgi:hypothetical protein